MHEMALAQRILQELLEAAEGQEVHRVMIQIGRLRMVAPDSLRFSFEMLAEGTGAAGAALEMEETPSRLRCGQCGAASELDLPPFNCPYCGASDIEVLSGDEVMLDAVELENGETIRRRAVPTGEILEKRLEKTAARDGGYYVQ